MSSIRVNLTQHAYTIHIKMNLFNTIAKQLKELNLGNLGIVITSKKIYNLYKKRIDKVFPKNTFVCVLVADGEQAKTKKCAFDIINHIVKHDVLNKKVYIVCLGGGTIGDVGGFVASIYKRGIPYVQVPTTLLAQIDSSIGGKTAINLKQAKNIVGTIYQPKAVFIDPSFLTTLPAKVFNEGLAEVVKYGVIKDKAFFTFLDENAAAIKACQPRVMQQIIEVCARIKADIVSKDQFETKGIRTILNFGHTLGHALEATKQYRHLSHGQAIAIGMVFAGRLSVFLGVCKQAVVEQIDQLLATFNLPTDIQCDPGRVCESLIYDKKFVSGKIRMVLVKSIGKVVVRQGISLTDIKRVLNA